MNIQTIQNQYSNNKMNFGAIRIKTGYSQASAKAKDICRHIDTTIKTKGHPVYPEADVFFFHNRMDEDKAERILLKEGINYSRNSIADIADTCTTQEWALTGNSDILFDWYLKHRK